MHGDIPVIFNSTYFFEQLQGSLMYAAHVTRMSARESWGLRYTEVDNKISINGSWISLYQTTSGLHYQLLIFLRDLYYLTNDIYTK